MDVTEMTPRRPYLFKAMYDWILDNELTPYIMVNTTVYGVQVPSEFIQDDKIILNIAPHSVGQYCMSNQQIEFNARFAGISQHIMVPMAAVEAIYAKENGIGLGFDHEPQYDEPQQDQAKKPTNPFRVVK